MTIAIDGELALLMDELAMRQAASGSGPRLVRDDDEPLDEWLEHLRAARAAADRGALRHRERVDEVSQRLFGETLAEVLPPVRTPLTRTTLALDVPAVAQLGDLVPALAGVAPVGPPPPAGARGGTDRILVRVTSPADPVGAIVRLHGGAFWMGGGEVPAVIDGILIDHLAETTGSAVFDIDYRLAPEHPYPAAIVDALCVLDAVRDGAAGRPLERCALMGTSSGANTAALAARADALRAPRIPLRGLALILPSMLLSDAPSVLRDDAEAWETRQGQLRGYLGDALDPADPWISPATESVIAGMPPTYMAIAAHDEVALGGEALRDAILAGGGSVDERVYAMTHVTAPPRVEAAVIQDAARFLAEQLRA